MVKTYQGGSDRVAATLLLARVAEALSIDPSALHEPDPLEAVRETPTGLNGHKPVELALSQALDRVEDVALRDHLERLLRTLEAERKSR